jgi:outer membrane murein-binding lipoprotein Lpp
MALYTPQAQRQQRLVILTVAAFVLGGVLGGFAGRLTAPTPADRVASVREQAQQMSSQLRVLSLHVEAGAASLGTGGDAGARLALQRADNDLTRALEQAPWITAERRNGLLTHLHALEQTASTGAATKPFAADVDRLAGEVDTTFGLPSTP